MAITNAQRKAQRTQDSCQSLSVKSKINGYALRSRVTNYLKTREGLWRLLAIFPKSMPVTQAVSLSYDAFTKCKKGGEA